MMKMMMIKMMIYDDDDDDDVDGMMFIPEHWGGPRTTRSTPRAGVGRGERRPITTGPVPLGTLSSLIDRRSANHLRRVAQKRALHAP